jgi:hypothetical protein
MKFTNWIWTETTSWIAKSSDQVKADLVILFFGSRIPDLPKRYEEVRNMFPDAVIVGTSTSGEILQEEVIDDSIVLSAIQFQSTKIKLRKIFLSDFPSSYDAGRELAISLPCEDLQFALLFSVGHGVNGTQLLSGIRSHSNTTKIMGGLAGDGDRFKETFVIGNAPPSNDEICLLGFYGESIEFKSGSLGGWNHFGPVRRITRSKDNILYELDGRPALDLYKMYLGEESLKLPSSALRFPLQIFPPDSSAPPVVRTILSINEEDKSMVFAGDMPENYNTRLMTANFENLLEGSKEAAKETILDGNFSSIALLVSCVGRKLVLGQRAVEEIEAVREQIGPNANIIGFYSYGEVSPGGDLLNCELHNQTMTITHFYERNHE